MDVAGHNRKAWDLQVEKNNRWTKPVSPEVIKSAREGEWSVLLTEQKPVPREWFGDIKNKKILCLASGGGQQGPVLSAAGAEVTVFDNSEKQLSMDKLVAEREGLNLKTVLGDMADLSVFEDEYFDIVFNPVSNCFAASLKNVWNECFRVTKWGGSLLTGILNPDGYIFNVMDAEKGKLNVSNKIPYNDLENMDKQDLAKILDAGDPVEFSHTMEEQLGGIIESGFAVTGFYEDRHKNYVIAEYIPTYYAFLGIKA